MLDGLSFDPFALLDDDCGPAEVGVGGRYVVQALVVALVIVMLDERFDLLLEIAGQEVVFQQDAVFQGLVPALDLALRLRVERRAANVAHGVRLDVIGKLVGNVAGPVIAQQPWAMPNIGRQAARGCQGHIQHVSDVLGPHRAAQPPGDDVAGVIVEHGREIHPAPANDLEVGEVSYGFASVQLRFRSATFRSPGSSGCGSGLPP